MDSEQDAPASPNSPRTPELSPPSSPDAPASPPLARVEDGDSDGEPSEQKQSAPNSPPSQDVSDIQVEPQEVSADARDTSDILDDSNVSDGKDSDASPPKKSRAVLSDDSSDDEPPAKKRALVSDDSDNEPEKKGSDSESPNKKKRVMMSSDDEGSDSERRAKRKAVDSDDDGERSGAEGEGDEPDNQELVDNIFGGSDDEKEQNREDEEDIPLRRRGGSDDEGGGFEWDFDRMMREKKLEKKRRAKKRGDGIDIINDDDGTVARMVEAMRSAAKDDRHANTERRPALKKRKMLAAVKTMLLRIDLVEPMLDGGMMSAVSEWLAPLPDKSLPCLEIRASLLKLLQSFNLEQGILKQSGLGKAVMLLYKHPREVKENKAIAQKLISEWARPIFNLHTDFRSLTRDERQQRDYDNVPEAARNKQREEEPSTSSHNDLDGKEEHVLRPGDKGYIGRARVPRPSKKDYVVRPKSLVDGEFKGASKGKGMNRLDRTQRDFKERTKKLDAKRAVGVSIEGRRMEL